MKKPKVNTSCIANRYASENERIIEITTENLGCLISIRKNDAGALIVQLYRLDPGIRVSVCYDDNATPITTSATGQAVHIRHPLDKS
jgi:hypothetical protein